MRRKKPDYLFWGISVLIFIGLALLTWSLAKQKSGSLEAFGWLTGAFIPAASYFYNQLQKRSLRFFLLTQQVKGIFYPVSLTWNLSAIFYGNEIPVDIVDKIFSAIKSLGNDKQAKIKRVNPYNALIEINPGPTLDITYSLQALSLADEPNASSYVQIHINNYRVGYREANHAIKKEIIPVLDAVTKITAFDSTTFTLTLEFTGRQNPFFSLYIANLPEEIVSKFHIRLVINEYEPDDTVLISESELSINAHSPLALQNLALEFLAFDSSLQGRLINA